MGLDGFFPVKMKRKDLDDVNDDFSDFSLSSPARKIRRLDAELPPIMEEDERDFRFVHGQPILPNENPGGQVPAVIEELSNVPENDERAIVLFKPMDTPLLQSPSSFSFSIDSNLLSGIKNAVLWSSQSNLLKAAAGETDEGDENSGTNKECMAVVPWVPTNSHHPTLPEPEVLQTGFPEMMEADDAEVATMDIEDNAQPGNEVNGTGVSEGLSQWQQHCMIPQPPQNLSTPITWFDKRLA